MLGIERIKILGSASRIGMDFGEWDKGFDLTNYID